MLPVVFCFLLFFSATPCSAYDISPYLKQAPSKSRPVLNLVFCSLSYQDKNIFLKDVDRLAQELKKTKPFDGFSDFSFWFVSLTKKEEGLLFTLTPGFPPLRAKSDFLQDIFVKLGRDYKLIIVDRTGLVSCAELSSINMTSLIILGRKMYASEESFSKGFLHELGHSLGLRDECVACEELSSAGEPNCARDKEEAIKWWGDLVGKDPRVNYISGCCGNKGYIRPTAVSLMNDPDKADDFGPVNERYLKQVLSLPAKK